MKNFIFMSLAALVLNLTGCSFLDSAPVDPKIIGNGMVRYDTQSGLWFAVIDSMEYVIAEVTIPENDPHSYSTTQTIQPVEGMQVTLFTSPHKTGIQAVPGKQSEEQIEKLYHQNGTGAMIFGLLLILGICSLAISINEEKVKKVNADR